MDLNKIYELCASAIALASILLVAMHWIEGILAIWCPKADPPQRFWIFYDRATKTIEYVSLSRQAWGKKPNGITLPQMRCALEMAQERNRNASDISQSMFGKELEALTRSEASRVISHLKTRGYLHAASKYPDEPEHQEQAK